MTGYLASERATSQWGLKFAAAIAIVVSCTDGGSPAGTVSVRTSPSLVPSASPAAIRALAEQRGLAVGGVDRTYRVYVPTALDRATPAPLLLWLHGVPGTSEGAEQRTGLNDQADQFRFVVAYPQGLPAANSWWNTGQCCGAGDDVAFILQIIDALAKEYRLDADRVYVAGLSAGGMMAHAQPQ